MSSKTGLKNVNSFLFNNNLANMEHSGRGKGKHHWE